VLKIADRDDTRLELAGAILEVAKSEEGLSGVVAAGGCIALVEALKIIQVFVSMAITGIARSEEGLSGVIAAGGYFSLVEV
jgi:hypothetical protein